MGLTDINDHLTAGKWLEVWLRHTLDLRDGISPKRLACAALVRILLWADEECSALDLNENDDEPILASMVGISARFLAEISHASVGLMQAIPPQLQSEIVQGESNSSAIFSFEVEGRNEQLLPLNHF